MEPAHSSNKKGRKIHSVYYDALEEHLGEYEDSLNGVGGGRANVVLSNPVFFATEASSEEDEQASAPAPVLAMKDRKKPQQKDTKKRVQQHSSDVQLATKAFMSLNYSSNTMDTIIGSPSNNNKHTGEEGHRRYHHPPHRSYSHHALINHVLPRELILRIFSYLDIVGLCRCAQVCRSWNKLAMDGSNWQEVDLFYFAKDVKAVVIENLARKCGGFLKKLSLKDCENVQDSAMRSFSQCPNIEHLSLYKCKLVTDSTSEYVGRYCHRLISLNLENCTSITDLSMKFVSEGCKRLKELNIGFCENITDRGIAYIAKGCLNLRELICRGCEELSSQCFAQLKSDFRELKRLNIGLCPNINDDTVQHISHYRRLEFLSLSNCKEITDLSLTAIAQGCPKIRDLELASCSNLSDSGFAMLSKHCHEIERMDLEDCTLITDVTLMNLNVGCPNLSSLALSHCENLTDGGLAELCAAHKECLSVLELDNCSSITDAALDYIKVVRSLERVDLFDCANISKDAIKRFKQVRPDVEVHAYFAPATPPPAQQPQARICRCCAII